MRARGVGGIPARHARSCHLRIRSSRWNRSWAREHAVSSRYACKAVSSSRPEYVQSRRIHFSSIAMASIRTVRYMPTFAEEMWRRSHFGRARRTLPQLSVLGHISMMHNYMPLCNARTWRMRDIAVQRSGPGQRVLSDDSEGQVVIRHARGEQDAA